VPTNIYGITETLCDPAYATSVGLLLWGAKHEGKQMWPTRGFGTGWRRFISRLTNLFR